MKKQIALLLLVLALLVSGVSALALEANEAPEKIVLYRYANISRILPALSVSGSTATYSLMAEGFTNVTKLSAVLQLQKLNGSGSFSDYGSSWNASSNSNYLYSSGTKPVDPIGTYRLKVTITPMLGTVQGQTETAYS